TLQQANDHWNARIAQLFEMSNRVQARCRARMPGDENQITFLRARGGPLEVVRRLHRLIVLVNADERHVDVESWKVEVVRIAAEKRCLKFRNKHETNVRVLFVAIKIVLTTLVKRDDVGTHSSRFQGFTFDRRNLSASGCVSFGVSCTSFNGAIDSRR